MSLTSKTAVGAQQPQRRRLSPLARASIALAVVEAATEFAAMFLPAVGIMKDGLLMQKPWVLPALFGTGLGVVWAATAVAPLICLILWADIWVESASPSGVVAVSIGTVAHVVFSLWLVLGMMFPPEFRGADFRPIPLTLGQLVLIGLTWLVAGCIRASDRSAGDPRLS